MLEIPNYRTQMFRQIFNVDENGNQTMKSRYYQNILRFFLKDTAAYFKVRNVANWLIEVLSLKGKANTSTHRTPSEIIEGIEKTLRKYCKQLTSCELLECREKKINKGGGMTFEYRLTNYGQLIALIIETKYDQGKKTYHQLYRYLQSYFMDESHSLDKFCIKYLEKCKGANLFEYFTDYLQQNLIYYDGDISNDHDLFTYMVLLRTGKKKIDSQLWEKWKESLSELNPSDMKLFQHNIKLKLEQIIEQNVRNYSEYERIRYLNRNKVGHISIEIYCAKCNDDTKCSYHTVPIMSYLASLFYDPKIIISHLGLLECTICGKSKFNYTVI